MNDDAGNWCLIESDPGVFTELIANFGVEDLQVEELYELGSLEDLSPVYGLIFLFKYNGKPTNTAGAVIPYPESANVFFAHQVITNACATQAILSVLMNSKDINLGTHLQEFKSFAADLPPDLKGLSISNSDLIRQVHNSFARSDPFTIEGKAPSEDSEDLFHFIAYIPVDGVLYELDGLRSGVVSHGECNGNWLSKVKKVIAERIASYGTEIRFNLMAIIKSRAKVYEEKLKEVETQLAQKPEDPSLLYQKSDLEQSLAYEQSKLNRYKRENARRKHNFIPLALELLNHLVKKEDVYDASMKKAEERAKNRREREERFKSSQ